eukprot:s58_g14.t1
MPAVKADDITAVVPDEIGAVEYESALSPLLKPQNCDSNWSCGFDGEETAKPGGVEWLKIQERKTLYRAETVQEVHNLQALGPAGVLLKQGEELSVSSSQPLPLAY